MTDGFLDSVQQFLLGSNFLQKFITFLLEVIIILVNIILLPINLLIAQFIPDLDGVLSQIAQLFDHASTYVGWVLSMLGVPTILLTLVFAYYTFSLTTRIGVWGVKLALKWVDTFR